MIKRNKFLKKNYPTLVPIKKASRQTHTEDNNIEGGNYRTEYY
jgi:hypothetical protein